MKKVAYCYMTHNHIEVVKDVMSRLVPACSSHGIDLYVCDDSTDTSVRNLTDCYIQQGYGSVVYTDMHFVRSGDEKMLYLMKEYGLQEEYDYIWQAKDRVSFSDSYLDRLIMVLEDSPDVVIGMDPHRRWNADRAYNRLLYVRPEEFYRDYGFYATNWEMLCFNVKTLVRGTDWRPYEEEYRVKGDSPFFRYTWLFERLTGMSEPKMVFCPYEDGDLYNNANAASAWWDAMYSLWIDRWIEANYTLPSLYDPYKMEVIKSLTNLIDKFGSVEQMMNYHAQGLYTIDIFKKYESMWPFITEIPVEWLRLIAEDDYDTVIRLAIADFEQSLRKKNYSRAYWLLFSNQWFSKVYSEQKYYALLAALYCFYEQMIKTGCSDAFEGLETIEDIVTKFG